MKSGGRSNLTSMDSPMNSHSGVIRRTPRRARFLALAFVIFSAVLATPSHAFSSPEWQHLPSIGPRNAHLYPVAVALLQEALYRIGLYEGAADGEWEEDLYSALVRFQGQRGLTVDGVVGPQTWTALSPFLPQLEEYAADRASPTESPGPCVLVDLYTYRLYVFLQGRIIREYPIATGKWSTPSPIGDWKVTQKARARGGAFGTRWIGLDVPWGVYGIHGTNQPGTIGRPASLGCIRMYNRHVEDLYRIIAPGTTVKIIGPIRFGRILRQGARGTEVYMVQRRLRELGLYDGRPDGVFGPRLKEAVRDFQALSFLPVTGRVDRRTWEALQLINE